MVFRFVMLTGERRGQQITIPEEALHVGRGADCGLVLNDPEVALDHAVAEADGAGGVRIRDLGSMGKILVNNREVRASTLKHGDVVELGRTRLLVQAVVEAEVLRSGGREYLRERLKRVKILRLCYTLTGLALLLFAAWFWLRKTSQADKPPASEASLATGDAGDAGDAGASAADATPTGADKDSVFHRLPNMATQEAGDAGPEAEFADKPELTMPPDTMGAGEPFVDLAGAPAKRADLSAGEPAMPPAPAPAATPPPAAAEVAAVTPPPAPPSPPAVDPADVARSIIVDKARGMVAEAERLDRQDRVQEADEMLASVERMLPEYAEAYAGRARLYEERGMLDAALVQWSNALARSPAGELRRSAQTRIEELEHARHQTVAAFAGRITLLSAEQKKFPENERVREMRTVTVRLQPGRPGDATDAHAVLVEVSFYDRDPKSGDVAPSRTGGGVSLLTVQGPWREGEVKTVTATYTIPIAPAREEQFYGYAVRVYHHGALQASVAEPPALLAQTSPPQGGYTGAAGDRGAGRAIVGQVP